LRLPAFARDLLEHRRRGRHPLNVDVVYGDVWSVPWARQKAAQQRYVFDGPGCDVYGDGWMAQVGAPCLAIRPREYAPGTFDFRCVTGLAVLVVDVTGVVDTVTAADGAVSRWGRVWSLCGELAGYAASVSLDTRFDGVSASVAQVAYAHRTRDAATGKYVWPCWWSDEIEARIGKRESVWFGAAGERAIASGVAT
jgi:hypothetical protein